MCVACSGTALLIPAAGRGVRMGLGQPKPLVEVKGKPILIWTLEPFIALDLTYHTIIVVSEELVDQVQRLVKHHYGSKVGLRVVPGGKDRQGSVYNGLLALAPDTEIVVIHDAVRPFVERRSILESIDAAKKDGAAAVATPVVDTIISVSEDRVVRDTPDRSGLWAVQTPQTFQYDTILRAHEQAEKDGTRATDDAQLVRQLGLTVKVVKGSPGNTKITTPHDLLVAERVIEKRGL